VAETVQPMPSNERLIRLAEYPRPKMNMCGMGAF